MADFELTMYDEKINESREDREIKAKVKKLWALNCETHLRSGKDDRI